MVGAPSGAATNNAAGTNAASTPNGIVETKMAERHVWLMKCPPVVSRSLHQYQQRQNDAACSPPDRRIAKVVVAVDPVLADLADEDKSSTEFTMELASAESGNVPTCYSLDMSTNFILMSVFGESTQGKLSVEGKICHKFDMKPRCKTIEDYGKLCRERTNKCMTKSRQIQVIDEDSGRRLRPMPGMVGMKSSGNQDKRKLPVRGPETKRTRRGRHEMEEIMFKLFERQPNWTLKQLIQETDQSEQYMKDMLKLLCVYNKKGPNQGTYELKPEYKKIEYDDSEPDSK